MGWTRAYGVALFWAIFAAVGVAQAQTSSVTQRWVTLESIHRLENPRNLTRPGLRGELGAYQFRASTWRMHSKMPFERALDRQASDQVAVRHYEWLKRGLERAGVEASVYNIALAWNSGLSAAIQQRSPTVAHDYAQRASSMAAALLKRTSLLAAAD